MFIFLEQPQSNVANVDVEFDAVKLGQNKLGQNKLRRLHFELIFNLIFFLFCEVSLLHFKQIISAEEI